MKARGVRVVAGRYRGRRLATRPGRELRPTGDRVKEALFSILGPRVEGALVVDAFAGTGALGIEALSRGAGRVVFVEEDPAALAILGKNLDLLEDGGETLVRHADALRPDAWGAGVLPADVILADPPYHRGLARGFLDALAGVDPLRTDGILALEHEREVEPAHAGWRPVERRRYGDTALSFFVPAPGGGKGGQDAHRDLSRDV